MTDLWPAVSLSLRIALSATVLSALIALPLAMAMSRRKFPGKSILEALIVVPLVMPPTVVGFAIIVLFGKRGWIGGLVYRMLGYTILFRFEGAVLAAAVVAMPLLYLPAKAAFSGVERDLEDSARVMGANRRQVFWHVTLPMARRGVFSGTILCFARALGEFGATVMVFGWQEGRVTLPVSIYADYIDGQLTSAAPAVIALAAVSIALMLAYNRATFTAQE